MIWCGRFSIRQHVHDDFVADIVRSRAVTCGIVKNKIDSSITHIRDIGEHMIYLLSVKLMDSPRAITASNSVRHNATTVNTTKM